MNTIKITFSDGIIRNYKTGQNGFDIIKSISKTLLKKTVAIILNNKIQDLSDPIFIDAKITAVLRTDKSALELIRHDAAHVMAEAVQELFPDVQITIGPVIKDGFYYDFASTKSFIIKDLEKIEIKMHEIIKRDKKIIKEIWSYDKAKKYFIEKNEKFKLKLLDMIPKNQDIKIYSQGNWLDLCKGPHLPSTGKIGDSFKLIKLSGSYWRGDNKNTILQRIYGTAWADRNQLKQYLFMLKEAKKRDHRKLGIKMNLFHFQNEAPGNVFWHPTGWTLFNSLVKYIRKKQKKEYLEVNTPDILDESLWKQSGHLEKYNDNMFTTNTPDNRKFSLKPMNCPGHIQIFKNKLRSYKNLPIRLREFGKVHRYEPSGSLHGLMRTRSFTQDDAHIFCTDEQIITEVIKTNNLILSIYKDFGFKNISIKFSDRPKKRVGSNEIWDKSEAALLNAINQADIKWKLNKGEGAFYGPKLEYILCDAIGRNWQCGTLQVDFNLPERFGVSYINKNGKKKIPVMLHQAVFGSLERFIGILIEHYAGIFPIWLAPQKIVICPIVSKINNYAKKIQTILFKEKITAKIDLRNEKINYKIREHSLQKIPIFFIIGEREEKNNTVVIRRLGSKIQNTLSLNKAIETILKEIKYPNE